MIHLNFFFCPQRYEIFLKHSGTEARRFWDCRGWACPCPILGRPRGSPLREWPPLTESLFHPCCAQSNNKQRVHFFLRGIALAFSGFNKPVKFFFGIYARQLFSMKQCPALFKFGHIGTGIYGSNQTVLQVLKFRSIISDYGFGCFHKQIFSKFRRTKIRFFQTQRHEDAQIFSVGAGLAPALSLRVCQNSKSPSCCHVERREAKSKHLTLCIVRPLDYARGDRMMGNGNIHKPTQRSVFECFC